MLQEFPVTYQLKDGTQVLATQIGEGCYEFHLTRLNSEKHNFTWDEKTGKIEESYETRFDQWQDEAVAVFRQMLTTS